MKINLTPLEILLLVLICLVFWVLRKYHHPIWRWIRALNRQQRRPRQLRPRAPGDCPECAREISWLPRRRKQEVVPWRERKSRRGRPKTIDTSGYACLEPLCDYFAVADPEVHALVGYGRRGQDDIQHFLCQAFQVSFSSRRDTVMSHLKTPLDVVDLAMKMVSEGLDFAKTARILERHPETIAHGA